MQYHCQAHTIVIRLKAKSLGELRCGETSSTSPWVLARQTLKHKPATYTTKQGSPGTKDLVCAPHCGDQVQKCSKCRWEQGIDEALQQGVGRPGWLPVGAGQERGRKQKALPAQGPGEGTAHLEQRHTVDLSRSRLRSRPRVAKRPHSAVCSAPWLAAEGHSL